MVFLRLHENFPCLICDNFSYEHIHWYENGICLKRIKFIILCFVCCTDETLYDFMAFPIFMNSDELALMVVQAEFRADLSKKISNFTNMLHWVFGKNIFFWDLFSTNFVLFESRTHPFGYTYVYYFHAFLKRIASFTSIVIIMNAIYSCITKKIDKFNSAFPWNTYKQLLKKKILWTTPL